MVDREPAGAEYALTALRACLAVVRFGDALAVTLPPHGAAVLELRRAACLLTGLAYERAAWRGTELTVEGAVSRAGKVAHPVVHANLTALVVNGVRFPAGSAVPFAGAPLDALQVCTQIPLRIAGFVREK